MKTKWSVLLFVFFILGFNSYAQYDFVVAKDSTGDFQTVQQAIDACRAFPDKQIVVFIKNGVYKEKIRISECNPMITLLGESKDNTIITFDDYFNKMQRGRNSTFYTATLSIESNDVILENLTIENGAGPVGQAVALHVIGDRFIARNCRLLGFQDTLYVSGEFSRQLYDQCYIEGTVDFIFGSATVYFNQCQIHSKSNAYLTASNVQQSKRFGFVFNNCILTADDGVDKVYLGRPWRDYANVVYLNCKMGKHISPVGWDNWSTPAREKTAYFAEYNSSGEGSDVSKRVVWSHQLSKEQSLSYSIDSVFCTFNLYKKTNDNWYH